MRGVQGNRGTVKAKCQKEDTTNVRACLLLKAEALICIHTFVVGIIKIPMSYTDMHESHIDISIRPNRFMCNFGFRNMMPEYALYTNVLIRDFRIM